MSAELSAADLIAIEAATQRFGQRIFAAMRVDRPKPWQRRWWDDQMLEWAMADEALKVEMFRFVDVLPALDTDEAVIGHLLEYFREVSDRLPAAARWGLSMLATGWLSGRAIAKAVRAGAQSQARRFIAGSNLADVLAAAERERKAGCAFTLDILGEAVTSDSEAQAYFEAYQDLIRGIAPAANAWPEIPTIDRDGRGPLPRANVSIKLSALDCRADEIDPAGSIERIAMRLRPLLRLAAEHRAFVNIDMESYHLKDLTLQVFQSVLGEPEFCKVRDVGIVLQCYLKDTERDLAQLCDWSQRRGTPVWVRLVKGAYWDYETLHAKANRWPVPVFETKPETDANFERVCRQLLRNSHLLRPAIASHNVRSLAHALAVAEFLGLAKNDFELQMLHGMADAEKEALVEMGYRLRIYMPYGELIPGMAYLVRRLLENTSNDSFLRASFSEQVAVEELLMNPESIRRSTDPATSSADRPGRAVAAVPFWRTYVNEPHADFARAENRQAMQAKIATVGYQLGRDYPLVIDGESVSTTSWIESLDPGRRARVVGRVAAGNTSHVERAVSAARRAQPAWAGLGAEARAMFIRDAAEVMRRRRFELAAWQMYECGKGWREADGDVCEAIDFCEYYAAGAVAMDAESGLDVAGERNRFVYAARGVAAIIAPWNFPLAILTGMTTAALATGNTAIMKPAEQSAVTAALLMDVFHEIGLPPGVLHYLPGQGEVVGAALVEHPEVDLIAFTGSRAVGLAINERAAQVSRHGTQGVKRVIAEMGGKNAIIVDSDADLDEAVLGVMHSAFGYQGQKCSACSRAIVVGSAYDVFLERLVAATGSLKVGPAEDPATQVGPVIDEASLKKINEYIAIGRREARQVLAVEVGGLAEQGNYVGPHIFADVHPDSRLAQEEIFGPVLAVIRAADFDEALRIANGTEYALTGGIYSRSPVHLERAEREMQVGNLYLNRTCTGAMVGRQPFGGFKMSGIGSKAGGPDYLLQFVIPRTITENTIRRGFAPSETE